MAVGVPACFTMVARISSSFVSSGRKGSSFFHGHGLSEPGRFRMKFVLREIGSGTKMQPIPCVWRFYAKTPWLIGIFFLVGCSANAALAQQIGKIVSRSGGIGRRSRDLGNQTRQTDPAQKLALIGTFAEGAGKEGDYPISGEWPVRGLLPGAEKL